jgi:Transposase DDE domain
MLDRTAERFGLKPQSLVADSAYGSAANLAWRVKQRGIAPHIPVFDKSNRTDGAFSRSDFVFDPEQGHYTCPQGKLLVQFHRTYATPRSGITKDGTRLYRASKRDCQDCALKAICCPNTPTRKIPRDLDEDARDVARTLADTPAYERSRHRRKKVEMLFAHLKRILRLGRLRLRGPRGARDEFLLAATAQNLRKLAKLTPMTALA